MANRPVYHGPDIIKDTAFSTAVFFGFTNRSSRLIINNLDAANDLLFKFNPTANVGSFFTLEAGVEPLTVVDGVMGISVKANAGQTILFEVLASHAQLNS